MVLCYDKIMVINDWHSGKMIGIIITRRWIGINSRETEDKWLQRAQMKNKNSISKEMRDFRN